MESFLPESFNIASLIVFGALGLLSLLAIAVAIYKWVQFMMLGVGRRKRAEEILDNWLSGRADLALQQAQKRKSVLARILQAVFSGVQAKPGDSTYAEELGRQTAIIELATMTDRMRTLEMVVQAAPMLGLLGTVIGMIDAFSALAVAEGAVDPTILAAGIYTALTTTAAGLAIALVAYFVANYFESRIERERNMIETVISAAIHGRLDPTKKL
ncbi:MAG: MotA/TolQ/ExbB proton channel family protein [Sagittula sp.]|jgi:biopolymer transport protein ExbB|uniref:MotA/TolQ/ExbB proton channel family protein n=1 Tax=unclassified Sagittula TaxID=2624628 RepID=UPI000C2D60A9|nr:MULTISPECIES: MotA/TolQ/ExbB proton channel family protein [unclassified Sagittula]AUC56141.1 flagellar motor protein MotA [Sagittula sp. P11]WHZ37971.1 MotA/TolQ/ExbB proton channel family protein [Sagittula sp. MA-2]